MKLHEIKQLPNSLRPFTFSLRPFTFTFSLQPSTFSLIVMAGMLCGMTGCVSTPARRIEKEPGVFASFPSEIQAKVQKGEVDLGFTRDMARLAQGRPHRVHSRITEAGQVEVWIYMGSRYISRFEPMDSGYWYRDRAGRMRRSYDTVWMDRGYSEEFPTLRLEFLDNKVKVIERLKR
jgi:hypothetical protein